MKNTLFGTITIIFLLTHSFCLCQEKSKTAIAVLDLDADGISTSESNIISARLRTELFNTGKFNVLERDKMDEILNEQGFQLSGCTTNECIVEVGKLTGVEKMVAGGIGRIGKLITINIRLIDVETGELIKTATDDCECSIESILTQSIRKVSQKLALDKNTTINYLNNNESIQSEQNSSLVHKNYVDDEKKMGLTKDEYIKFNQIGLPLDKFNYYRKNGFTFDDLLILKKSSLPENLWVDYKKSGKSLTKRKSRISKKTKHTKKTKLSKRSKANKKGGGNPPQTKF